MVGPRATLAEAGTDCPFRSEGGRRALQGEGGTGEDEQEAWRRGGEGELG